MSLPAGWQEVVARIGRTLQMGGGADRTPLARSVQAIVTTFDDGAYLTNPVFRSTSEENRDIVTNPVAGTTLATITILTGIWDYEGIYSADSDKANESAAFSFSEFPSTHFLKSFAGTPFIIFTGTLENSVRELGATLEFTQMVTSTGKVFTSVQAIRRGGPPS